jgi:hypothetical protein
MQKHNAASTFAVSASQAEMSTKPFGSGPGLPDGLFSNQKYQFGSILEGLRLENVDIFYGHSEYFTDIWDSL